MKMRKLTLMLMLAGCSVVTVDAQALSLGEADLESYLDQPLEAAIPLLQVRDLNTQEVLVNLASQEDFDKAGIERSAILSNLKFQVMIEPGQAVGTLRVFTTQPVNALYLNFLVDVHWPSGHLVREYTLLIDPPANIKATPALNSVVAPELPISAVPSFAAEGETMNKSDISLSAQNDKNINQFANQESKEIKNSRVENEPKINHKSMRRRIHEKDMLWQIASHMRPNSSVTMQQTMLAIQKHNPHAFIRGNINLIKTGAVLTAPSLKQIKAISVNDANQEVSHQTRAWLSRHSFAVRGAQNKSVEKVQLEGSNRNLTPKDKSSSVKGGHVELLSAVDKNTSTSKKMGAIDSQSADAEKTLALLGEQLDQSTIQLKDKQDRLHDVTDQVTTSHKLIALKDSQMLALQNQLKALEEKSQATLSDVEPVVNSSALAPQQKTVQPLMEEIKQPLAVKASGQVSWYANPWSWLVILAAGSVLAVGSAVAYRRRKEEELLYEEDSDDDFIENTTEEKSESELVVESKKMEEVLAEVDLDLAYGRYQRAVKLLEQAIQHTPDQIDLRMKLLEIYAQIADQSAFEQQAGQLQALGDADVDSRIISLRKNLVAEQQSGFSSAPDSATKVASSMEVQLEKTAEEKPQFFPDFDFSNQKSVKEEKTFTLDDDLAFGKALEQMEATIAHEIPSKGNAQPASGEILEALDFPELDDLLPASSSAESVDHWNMDLNSELGFDSSDIDEIETKLDLARAYIDMGDKEGARDILAEVVAEGSSEQQQQAKDLLVKVEFL